MAVKAKMEELVKAGAHYGHQSRRWNPKMEEYLYGESDGVHIFDVEKTEKLLNSALDYLRDLSSKGGAVLILGTKKQAKKKVEEVAKDSGVFFVNERWLGGTFTNFDQIKKSIRKLKDLKEKMDSNYFSDYTKKERLLIDREIDRLERFFGGIADMEDLPQALIVVDTKKEVGAVREAVSKKITVVGIVDSNSDPTDIDYPIPMNDDAIKGLDYVLTTIGEVIKEGKNKSAKIEKKTSDKEKKVSEKKTKSKK